MRMKKRLFCLLLALVLSAGVLPLSAAAVNAPAYALADYVDLDADAWYAQGVGYCLAHDLMVGAGGGARRFAPNETLTRAQAVATLWRMEGRPGAGLAMQYVDVPEGVWYEEAVRWGLTSRTMEGDSISRFMPDEPVTREQLVTALWRYARYRNGTVPILPNAEYQNCSDKSDVSVYAVEAMQWACGLGLLYGGGNRESGFWLKPAQPTSRAEAATILMRFCLDLGVYE